VKAYIRYVEPPTNDGKDVMCRKRRIGVAIRPCHGEGLAAYLAGDVRVRLGGPSRRVRLYRGGIQMAAREKKNFVLMEEGKDTNVVFSSAQPRGAALKAATRGVTNIRLRERGTKRVHVFEGERRQVSSPTQRPKWLPDTVWKSQVKKIGIETV